MSTFSPVNVHSRVLEFYEKDAPIGNYKLPIRDHAETIAQLMEEYALAVSLLDEPPAVWLCVKETTECLYVGPNEFTLTTKHQEDRETESFFTTISFPLLRVHGLRDQDKVMRNKEATMMIKRSWLPLVYKSFALDLLRLSGGRVKVIERMFKKGIVTWVLTYDEVPMTIQFNEACFERHRASL